MASKGKVRSMQRGALVRPSRERDDGKYPGLKIQMTKGEYPNFEFGQQTLDVTINRLQPLVRSYAKAGFRKPVDVARLLNKAGEKTACGQPWSPRLVALLLSRMFTGSFERAIVPTTSLRVHSAPRPQRGRVLGQPNRSPQKCMLVTDLRYTAGPTRRPWQKSFLPLGV